MANKLKNINDNKMKTQRVMDSKAGTSKNEISVKLKNIISKSASSLLIAMAGFGMMSFNQEDNVVNQIDTNLTQAELAVNTDNCCATEVAKPAIGPKKATISFTASQVEIHKADVENARNFIKEEKERRVWGMNLEKSFAKADNEIKVNFRMSMLYPEKETAKATDAKMNRMFEEEILRQAAHAAIEAADRQVYNNFWKDNFSISVPVTATSADVAMHKAFEDAIFPYISYPSKLTVASADAEVASNHTTSKEVSIAIK